jgi:hypothetical protein
LRSKSDGTHLGRSRDLTRSDERFCNTHRERLVPRRLLDANVVVVQLATVGFEAPAVGHKPALNPIWTCEPPNFLQIQTVR